MNVKLGLTRERVLSAAATLADTEGLPAVTVSSVARVVGVKAPSLYAHVRSTDELHAALTVLALDELADAIDCAIAGLAGRDALTALAETHRAYARERPGRYDAAGALDRPATDDLARAAGRHAAQQQAILRGYALGADAQVHATRLVASMLRGFIQLEAAGAFAHREPRVEETWPLMLDVLDAAIRAHC